MGPFSSTLQYPELSSLGSEAPSSSYPDIYRNTNFRTNYSNPSDVPGSLRNK
jgi:hypothetical protein